MQYYASVSHCIETIVVLMPQNNSDLLALESLGIFWGGGVKLGLCFHIVSTLSLPTLSWTFQSSVWGWMLAVQFSTETLGAVFSRASNHRATTTFIGYLGFQSLASLAPVQWTMRWGRIVQVLIFPNFCSQMLLKPSWTDELNISVSPCLSVWSSFHDPLMVSHCVVSHYNVKWENCSFKVVGMDVVLSLSSTLPLIVMVTNCWADCCNQLTIKIILNLHTSVNYILLRMPAVSCWDSLSWLPSLL